jgi:hypothetical protein
MKNIFFVIACCGLIISCSNKNNVPSDIIQPVQMQKILWDVLRADALSSEYARRDSTINQVAELKILTEKVFQIHKISSATFDKSYKWYTGHQDVLKIVFDSLNSQAQRENKVEMKEKIKPVKKIPL